MDNCKNTENIHEKEQAGEKKEYYKNIKKNCLIEKIIEKDKEIMQYKKDIEKIEEKLSIVENDANIYKNQLIRMQADFDNYKKREEKKKKEYIEYANKDLICQLLSVIDNLERAVSYSKDSSNKEESIREGIENILNSLHKILNKEGLKPIEAVGEKFDPFCHEAIMQVESDDYPEDTVVEELNKGYYLKSNVIRPATVKVSKKCK